MAVKNGECLFLIGKKRNQIIMHLRQTIHSLLSASVSVTAHEHPCSSMCSRKHHRHLLVTYYAVLLLSN